MAVCSSISISQVEYLRLDADFYHPKYLKELEIWNALDGCVGVAKLSHLISASIRTGRTPSSRHIKEEDEIVPFIKTDGIREGRINFDSAGDLPKRVLTGSDFIPADSVVVTIIGATPEIVGRAAIVRDADPRCVTNQNVAVITTNSKCDPYFLTAYFQTSFGRDQLWRHSRRTEQVNLNCREVERVLVPTPEVSLQNEIGDLIRASFAATDDSESLYTQAQQLLEAELGLDKLCFDKPLGYAARFSDTFVDRRIDAEYFQPQFKQVNDHVKAHLSGCQPLLSVCASLKPNIDPSKSPTDIFDYIELANIKSSLGVIEGATRAVGGSLPSRARRKVMAGDVLASSVVGSIDKSALINQEVSGFIASTGFFHLRPQNVSPEYLFMLVKSRLVRMQLQQQSTGGILSAVPDSRLRYVVVPTTPQSTQDQITQLVKLAHAKYAESKLLVEKAKARVEQLIEDAVRA